MQTLIETNNVAKQIEKHSTQHIHTYQSAAADGNSAETWFCWRKGLTYLLKSFKFIVRRAKCRGIQAYLSHIYKFVHTSTCLTPLAWPSNAPGHRNQQELKKNAFNKFTSEHRRPACVCERRLLYFPLRLRVVCTHTHIKTLIRIVTLVLHS